MPLLLRAPAWPPFFSPPGPSLCSLLFFPATPFAPPGGLRRASLFSQPDERKPLRRLCNLLHSESLAVICFPEGKPCEPHGTTRLLECSAHNYSTNYSETRLDTHRTNRSDFRLPSPEDRSGGDPVAAREDASDRPPRGPEPPHTPHPRGVFPPVARLKLLTPSIGTRIMALGVPASILGLIVSGDCSGETIYTDRHGRKIHFPIAPPKEPPTQMQVDVRTRFKSAQQEYMALAPIDKEDWELLTKRASMCMTGQNLFISVAMKRNQGILDTIMQQTGVTVVSPTPV